MSERPDGDKPLDHAAGRVIARVQWLMLVSGATTLVAIAAVVGAIGYRIYRSGGSAAPPNPSDVTALIPKEARIISTAVGQDRIAVTIETGGTIEIRTFDLTTLRPTGRLRFTTEP